jgi:hypothetical protein
MKNFLRTLILFTVFSILTIVILIFLSNEFVKRNTFNNWETESNLLVIKNNQQYDALFMGISHARNLSRHKNHLRIEAITGKKIINIGRGGYYSGLLNQYLYLKYFYAMGNTAHDVIIILTPVLMYSYVYDDASNIFEDEPISFTFIRCYLSEKNDYTTRQLFYYMIDKLSPQWILTVPTTLEKKTESLDSLDRAKVESGMRSAYLNGMENKVFENRKALIYKILEECKRNTSRVIFIIPPALFGKWKGHETVVSFLEQLHNQDPAIAWYDCSESVLNPKLYYDHHHLNSAGVVYFTEKYLKDIMK